MGLRHYLSMCILQSLCFQSLLPENTKTWKINSTNIHETALYTVFPSSSQAELGNEIWPRGICATEGLCQTVLRGRPSFTFLALTSRKKPRFPWPSKHLCHFKSFVSIYNLVGASSHNRFQIPDPETGVGLSKNCNVKVICSSNSIFLLSWAFSSLFT